MLFLVVFHLVPLINAQTVVLSRLSKFIPATYQPDLAACAISSPDRSFGASFQAQCVHGCLHGDRGQVCVGVNFQQRSNSCEVYNNCPTTYTLNSPGCQFIQVWVIHTFQITRWSFSYYGMEEMRTSQNANVTSSEIFKVWWACQKLSWNSSENLSSLHARFRSHSVKLNNLCK